MSDNKKKEKSTPPPQKDAKEKPKKEEKPKQEPKKEEKPKQEPKKEEKPKKEEPKKEEPKQESKPKEEKQPKEKKEKKNDQNAEGKKSKKNESENKEKVEEVQAPAPVSDVQPDQPVVPEEGQQPASDGPKERKPREKKARVADQGIGVVKAVISGDTLIILHAEKNGPPIEKQITLSNIAAPKLGRFKGDTTTKDEPWAWPSREFLRKKVIGKVVSYAIENPTQLGGYGLVFLDKESVAKMVVSAGWARVKKPTGEYSRSDIDELISIEESVSREGKGVFNTKEDGYVRDIVSTKENLIGELFAKWRAKAQNVNIEQVRAGHSLRGLVRDEQDESKFYDIPLILTGVKSPDYNQQTNIEEPFTYEARFFVEHLILHRQAQVIFDAFDKRAFYGTVSSEGIVLNEQVLKNGLGAFVEWPKSNLRDRLSAAQKAAQDKKLRIWNTFVDQGPVDDKKGGASKEVWGTVIEVRDVGTLTILDQSRKEVKINLSSIKVPRVVFKKEGKEGKGAKQGKQEGAEGKQEVKEEKKEEKKEAKKEEKKEEKKDEKEPKGKKAEEKKKFYAFEGKEYLRKRTIGQRVRCIFDYSRPGASPEQVERQFYSVYVDKNNVAVELAENGYIEAAEHRGGEPRSKDYDQILLAETLAKKSLKGLWSSSSPTLNISDLTQEETDVRAKNLFPLLQRSGKLRGIIEHEISGTKYKIYVPKESCLIPFTLSAVRGPGRDQPFSKEAVALAREIAHQREIEFNVNLLDKGGNFVGNAWILLNGRRRNLATLFLEEGYASLIPGASRDNENATELMIAEEAAKKARKNIWKNYDPEAEEAERQKKKEQDLEKQKPKTELVDIIVTEIVDASKFYVQAIGPEQKQLEELMKSFTLKDLSEPYTPNLNEDVIAKFTGDDAWYRAKVRSKNSAGEFEIFYIDFGNSEFLPVDRIRQIDAEYTKLAPQAKEARLAYLKVPSFNQEFGHEAAELFKEMVWDKTLHANVEYREGDVLYLSLGDRESQVHVNAALLRAGLGRVEKVRNRNLQSLISKLKEEENKARAAHLFMWRYGDPGSDDEEGDRDLAMLQAKKAAEKKKDKTTASPKTAPKEEKQEEKPKEEKKGKK